MAAPHPCASPGCRVLVERGQARCKKHTAEKRLEKKQRDHGHYQLRAWRDRLRKIILQRDPLCQDGRVCGGRAASTEVHHLKAVREHPELFWAEENLQGVCHRCHSAITASENNFGGAQ